MNEIEALKKRVLQLEQILNMFVQSDSYTFQRDVELFTGKYIRASSGLRLGKSATDKIGFYGTSPVARQNAISAPSGGTTVDSQSRTAIGTIIAVLQNIGLTG